jgi:N-acetylglutamate synthase-like GNAT family acetyltransferase
MKVVPHRIIRKANRDEIQVMLAFDTESGVPGHEALIERAVTQGDAYVVEQEDVVIAISVLEYTFFEQGFVSLIYVKGQQRRTGAGEMLLRHLTSICRTPKLFSSTNRSNLPMQALLLKTGFTESGIVYNLDAGDPEVIYYQEIIPKNRDVAEAS